jgi:hypothetical protein
MFQTAYSTWEPQWSETEHEVFRDFGFAAFAAQMLEASLVQVLLAVEHDGKITFNKKKDIESELFLSRKTFGQLVGELRRAGLGDEHVTMLEDALEARNFLMHHFFSWHSADFTTPEGRGRMLKELQSLRFRIGRVQMVFKQIRAHIYEQVFGVTADQVRAMYRAYLQSQRET